MKRKKSSSGVRCQANAAELPDAELEVLACLWQRGQATAREIREAMAPYRPMAHGSVVTLLMRLSAKEWVTRKKADRGKAFIYLPTRQSGPAHRKLLRKLVSRVFGGNGIAAFAALLDSAPPTADQLGQLQEMLDRLREEAGSGEVGDE